MRIARKNDEIERNKQNGDSKMKIHDIHEMILIYIRLQCSNKNFEVLFRILRAYEDVSTTRRDSKLFNLISITFRYFQ